MPQQKPHRAPLGPAVPLDRLRGVRISCVQAAAQIFSGDKLGTADVEFILATAQRMYDWVIEPEIPKTEK